MDAMYAVAARLTGSGANAEDLVAETVIKAWSCIDKLQDRGCWRAWIFRILRNEYISNYRKKSVRPREIPFEEDESGETDSIASLLFDQPDEFLNWWADPEHEYITRVLPDKIELAKEYIRRSSLRMDFRLIILTLFRLFK